MKTFHIAIIGAGPSGFYSSEALLQNRTERLNFTIDIIEKLPMPGGLIRTGVAPDHEKIKDIANIFDRILDDSSINLFANIEVGSDVTLEELSQNYDAVVLATGASTKKYLNIYGENLNNVFSSTEIAFWYNSYPEFQSLNINLDIETALIVGVGNVALDFARIFLKDSKTLEATDISIEAFNKLRSSRIKKVIICARRGPEHISFSLNEIKEILKIPGVRLKIKQSELKNSIENIEKFELPEPEKTLKILKYLQEFSNQKTKKVEKIIEFKFNLTPVQICGEKSVKQVVFFNLENNMKKRVVIKTSLLISAIGYLQNYHHNLEVKNNKILNLNGYVKDNIYVVGWAKRGPNGVIGSNKKEAKQVVELVVFKLKTPKTQVDLKDLIKQPSKIIDKQKWKRINMLEVHNGLRIGKRRLKFSTNAELKNI